MLVFSPPRAIYFFFVRRARVLKIADHAQLMAQKLTTPNEFKWEIIGKNVTFLQGWPYNNANLF